MWAAIIVFSSMFIITFFPDSWIKDENQKKKNLNIEDL